MTDPDVQGDTTADNKMANVQGDTPHSGFRGRSGTLIAQYRARRGFQKFYSFSEMKKSLIQLGQA